MNSVGCGSIRVCRFLVVFSLFVCWFLNPLQGLFCSSHLRGHAATGTSGVLTVTDMAAVMRWSACDHHFGAETRLSVQGICLRSLFAIVLVRVPSRVSEVSMARSLIR